VPVAPDHVRPHREVAVRDLHPGRDTWLTGQQAVLEGKRGPPLPVIEPGVVDAYRGPGGQFGG